MSEVEYRARMASHNAGKDFAQNHPEAVAKARAAIEYLKAQAQAAANKVNKVGVQAGAASGTTDANGNPVVAPVSMYLEDQPKFPAAQQWLNQHFFEPNRPPVIELDEDSKKKK